MIGLMFVVIFAGVAGAILLVIALAVFAAQRSAGTARQRRPGQPHGRPGNLDWLPQQGEDLQRQNPYGVWTDGGAAGGGHDHHGHHGHHGPQQHHDHGSPSPSPSSDSGSSWSHHDSGAGGSHHF